jgi:hypothetical protein
MNKKIKQALDALSGLNQSNETDDKLLQIARGALLILQKRGTNREDSLLFSISDISRLADQVGLELMSDELGEDFGPFVLPMADDLIYN